MSQITSMEHAYRVFLEVLRAFNYDTRKLKVKQLHFANWFVHSDEGLFFFKHSKDFFHLAGECESIDKSIIDMISKDPVLEYMTIIFAQEKIFYSIPYGKWLKERFEYTGGDGVPRWLIKKSDLKIWHVVT